MRRPWLRALRALVYAVAAFALLVAFAGWVGGDRGEAVVLAGLALAVIALVLWSPAVFGAVTARRVRRNDPNVEHPIRFAFDADGLLVTCHTAETRLHWDGMPRVVESPEFLFFFYSPVLAYYLPKRVVDDVPALVRSLTSWLPAGKAVEQVG